MSHTNTPQSVRRKYEDPNFLLACLSAMSHTYIPQSVRRKHEKVLRTRLSAVIVKRIAHTALGENADYELVRSMIQRAFNLKEESSFIATLKRRVRLTQERGLPLSVFRDVSIDTPLADEIALLNEYTRKGEADAAQNKQRGTKHRERAKGVTGFWIAQKFSSHAIPLIRGKDEDGKPIYERARGGNHSGYCLKGQLTESAVKKWIKNYPDEHNAEPKSGFHAEMLTDEKAIEAAAKRWGDYWRDYAEQFYLWRQEHPCAPRNQFRYKPAQTVHGAEKIADRRK